MRILIWTYLFLLLTSTSWSNGGPIEWTGPTTLGTLRPVHPEGLSLLRENLFLSIDQNGSQYRVKAEYWIKKSKRNVQKVQFALPLMTKFKLMNDGSEEEESQVEKVNNEKEAAKSVELKIAGKVFPCHVVPTSASSSQLRQQGNINNTVSWTDFKSWCIAEIPFPDTVGEIKLEMSYMASLFFVDTEISTDPIISRDFRTLNYPLFPAAIWAADSFVGKLELNNSGPLELIAKPNSSGKYHPDLIKKDDKYFFEFKKSFLQKPGYLEIIFSALNLEFAQRATYNKNARESHKVPMVATANTSIEPKSKYGPQFAIDGDPNTAWCFKNNDVAPEITLNSSEKIKNRELSIIFIQVAGGYLKNQKIYEANGKPIELEVSSCDGKIKRTIKTEKPGPDYRNAWLTLKPETTQKFKDWVQEKEKNKDNNYTNGPSQWDLDKMINSGCFKIKIKKIKPGTDPDTCVSEIIPFIF